MEFSAFARSSFFPDHLPDAPQFLGHLLVGGDDVIERVGDLSLDADPSSGETHREIAVAHRLQRHEDNAQIGRGRCVPGMAPAIALYARLQFRAGAFRDYIFIGSLHVQLQRNKILLRIACLSCIREVLRDATLLRRERTANRAGPRAWACKLISGGEARRLQHGFFLLDKGQRPHCAQAGFKHSVFAAAPFAAS